MPIHDWTRVSPGVFHSFRQDWTNEIRRTLNRGLLPAEYAALTDLRVDGWEPDVVTIKGTGPFEPLPADKPLTVASYEAGTP
jgi:hypothetical protein